MSVNDVEAASRRVQAMRTRLDDVLAEFSAGEPVRREQAASDKEPADSAIELTVKSALVSPDWTV